MRFYFPDSQDQIDPNFDFGTEAASEFRVRQRDDRYAHEVLARPAYDGLLISKAIVDGLYNLSGKYTAAQRHRLYREGVRRFYRLDQCGWNLSSMGDCGSFAYVTEDAPPYDVDDVIDFYDGCGFDFGLSLDHVVLGYDESGSAPEVVEWRRRQELTLELAAQFFQRCNALHCRFEPLGVAQGWSPSSYAESVDTLQKMGYRYIALGGMVPLKTHQIHACLAAVGSVRRGDTQLHLLGISRCEEALAFVGYGVASFDSTSAFRQAFKDDKDNYYTAEGSYLAIRVPQVEGNARLKGVIRAGRIDQTRARVLEMEALGSLAAYDRGQLPLDRTLESVMAYSELVEPGKDRAREYRRLLEAKPWQACDCGVCGEVGINVVIFRGTERNKRRGFHNLAVFAQRLKGSLGADRA